MTFAANQMLARLCEAMNANNAINNQ